MTLHPCAQNTRERWFSQQASTLGTKWAATTRVDICPFCDTKADTHRTGTHTITEDDGILTHIYPLGMTFPVWFCDEGYPQDSSKAATIGPGTARSGRKG